MAQPLPPSADAAYAPPPFLPSSSTFPSPISSTTTSFWMTPPHPLATHRSTPSLPPKTDILIVGAGMTGVSLAYHLVKSTSTSTCNSAPTSSRPSSASPPPKKPGDGDGDGDGDATPQITILEARTLCSGATGRNGGHAKPPPWHMTHVAATRGEEAAAELVRFQVENVKALADVVVREGLAGSGMGYLPGGDGGGGGGGGGGAAAAAGNAGVGSAEEEVKEEEEGERIAGFGSELLVTRSWDVFVDWDMWARRRDGVRALQQKEDSSSDVKDQGAAALASLANEHIQILDGTEWGGTNVIEGITGVRGAVGAFSVPAVSLWPYRLVCGLYERIRGQVNLQTQTRVVGVSEQRDEDGYWVVSTQERGEIRARVVVFATNAYTAGVLEGYQGVIVPVKGTACKVERRNGDESENGRQRRTYTYNVFKEDGQVDYLVHRPDGGAIVGGATETFKPDLQSWAAVVDDGTLLAEARARPYFERRMQTAWRDWEESGVEIDKIWTGIMGVTADGYPHIGAVPGKENQYICAGFNGAGMPHIFLSTKGLARMLRDGAPFEDVGIPRIFQVSEERIKAPWAKDRFTAPKGFR